VAKNGQRCVSIKHIFIPTQQEEFISSLQKRLTELKTDCQREIKAGTRESLGPLISPAYAKKTANKVQEIVNGTSKPTALIELERHEGYIFPAMYRIDGIETTAVQEILSCDLPGPVVFVHTYRDTREYERIFEALENDYIRSGLQLSIFTQDQRAVRDRHKRLLWGGIIVNDIPTFRDDAMSFGGFGRAGLGKEGFFETARAYTDPQTVVYSSFS
jgi:acyl-CoA reductase-like NAD-dependent aldehyde dehydrogenase